MGGDWLVIFNHKGGSTIDTSESTIKPAHGDNDHEIDRDVSFMNHKPGNTYSEEETLRIVIPESDPQPEFGESFAIKWTSDGTEWYTIGEHFWGQNYRDDVP
nr:hypothetical protein [Halovivax sp. KZCA124]